MTTIIKGYLITGVLYGLLGMALGLHMAISQDHSQMPVHAHIMVIGWLSFFVFGLYYHRFSETISRMLATLHFWVSQLSFVGLVTGLWLLYSGLEQYEPVAAISSIVYALSFVVFTVIVFQSLRNA